MLSFLAKCSTKWLRLGKPRCAGFNFAFCTMTCCGVSSKIMSEAPWVYAVKCRSNGSKNSDFSLPTYNVWINNFCFPATHSLILSELPTWINIYILKRWSWDYSCVASNVCLTKKHFISIAKFCVWWWWFKGSINIWIISAQAGNLLC